MRIRSIIWIFLCTISSISGQEVLSLDEYLDRVRAYHPVIKQSQLLDDKSEAYMRKAKGSVDPVLSSGFNGKSFDEKEYYNLLDATLKLPTALGVDVEVNYERNTGEFLNDQAFLPQNGLLSAGVSVPLVQGLAYNNRRFLLDEAKNIGQQNMLKRIEMVNKILYSAVKVYLDWEFNYRITETYREAVDIASIRLDNTIDLVLQGDKPAIDTVEARQNLLNNNINYQSALMQMQASFTTLRNFLWSQDGDLYSIDENVQPQQLSDRLREDRVQSMLVDVSIDDLPMVRSIELENQLLNLERRNVSERIKPQVDLKFNPLLRLDQPDVPVSFSAQDYKVGLNVYFPILGRKARGERQLIEIELQENQLLRSDVSRQIETEIAVVNQQIQDMEDILSDTENNVLLAERLLDAENERFSIGESSVFLVNSREQKLLENRLKRWKLIYQINKRIIDYYFITRQLEDTSWN